MACPHCVGLEKVFGEKTARRELRRYRRRGPIKTTQILLDLLRAEGVAGATLLDVGGGVGALQHELAASGLSHIVSVDASTAYLRAAQEEAAQRHYADRVEYVHGDFVELAKEVASQDLVTLDRVICCYPDPGALVGLTAARARRAYGFVLPNDRWWAGLAVRVENLYLRIVRNPFRSYRHPLPAIESILRASGLEAGPSRRTWFWRVAVWRRRDGDGPEQAGN